jgi:hypothetical protein
VKLDEKHDEMQPLKLEEKLFKKPDMKQGLMLNEMLDAKFDVKLDVKLDDKASMHVKLVVMLDDMQTSIVNQRKIDDIKNISHIDVPSVRFQVDQLNVQSVHDLIHNVATT